MLDHAPLISLQVALTTTNGTALSKTVICVAKIFAEVEIQSFPCFFHP